MAREKSRPAGSNGESDEAAAKRPLSETATTTESSGSAPAGSADLTGSTTSERHSNEQTDGNAGSPFALEGLTPAARTGFQAAPQSPEDAATSLLRKPNIYDLVTEIQADIRASGVVGEAALSLLIYLVGTSRLLDEPLAAIIQGPSAAGKSYLVARISKLFPDKALVQAHRITPQALVDIQKPSEDLVHRFVVGGERSRRRDPEATRTLRELLADGHTSVLRKGRRIDVKGPIAFVESTTLEPDEIFGEDLNRCVLVRVDASAQQTKRIQLRMAERVKTPVPPDPTPIIKKHQAVQAMLKRCYVYIPYSTELAELYPDDSPERRRSFGHLLSLIRAITLLRQYQQTTEPADGMPLAADLNDYRIARSLLMTRKDSGLSGKIGETYQALSKLGSRFSTADVAAAMKRDYADTSVAVRELKSRNLIRAVVPARGRQAAQYELVPSTDGGFDLPEPEMLTENIRLKAGGKPNIDLLYVLNLFGDPTGKRGYDIVLSPYKNTHQLRMRPSKQTAGWGETRRGQ